MYSSHKEGNKIILIYMHAYLEYLTDNFLLFFHYQLPYLKAMQAGGMIICMIHDMFYISATILAREGPVLADSPTMAIIWDFSYITSQPWTKFITVRISITKTKWIWSIFSIENKAIKTVFLETINQSIFIDCFSNRVLWIN